MNKQCRDKIFNICFLILPLWITSKC